jgi:hypothetical protein
VDNHVGNGIDISVRDYLQNGWFFGKNLKISIFLNVSQFDVELWSNKNKERYENNNQQYRSRYHGDGHYSSECTGKSSNF